MKRLFPWGVILLLVIADQVTKIWVLRSISFQDSIVVIPGFFNLTHIYNTGAAFGMLHDSNRFFLVLSIATFIVLVMMRRHFCGRLMSAGWMLLLAGIIGNVIDRLRLGHVVDFLDFQIGTYHWPSFNVADSCICIAAGLFLLASFQTPEVSAKKAL